MADVTRTGNPFFDAWMDAGRRFLEPVGQANPMTAMIGGAGMSDAVTRAQENLGALPAPGRRLGEGVEPLAVVRLPPRTAATASPRRRCGR